MKRLILALVAVLAAHGLATAQTIPQLPAASNVQPTDQTFLYQTATGNTGTRAATTAQIVQGGGALTSSNVATFPVLASNCTNTTIQAAINAAAANGGGIVQIPVGVCTVAANLTVNNSYIGFKCVGPDGIHTGTVVPTACSLKWTGASGGAIMTISAPTGSTSDSFLTGISIEGITFDGNAGLAANALTLQSMRNSRFQNLYAQSFNGGYVFYIGTVHATTSNFGDSCDTQFNLFDNISINQFAGSSIGIYLDAWLNASYENDGCGGTFNTFRNIDMGTSSGQGLVFHGADNNQFYNVRIYDTVNTVRAVEFTIASGGGITYPANSNVIYHMSTNAHIYADGQSTNPGCVAYTSAFGLTSCTQANKIYDLDKLDGTPDPTVEPGAQLIWTNTTGAAFGQQSGPLAIGDTAANALTARANIGNASLYLYNQSQDQLVFANATDVWGINIDVATHNLEAVTSSGGGTSFEVPGLSITTTPSISVLAATNIWFGSNSNTQTVNEFTASSATLPEAANETIVTSNTGSANAGSAFKVGNFVALSCSSGSSSCYGLNTVVQANTGFNSLLTGHEIDLNFNTGRTAGSFGSANAAYNLVLAGTVASSTYPATAALWITGAGSNYNSMWYDGVYISPGPTSNGFEDASNSATAFTAAGSHTTGLDTTNASLTYALNAAANQLVCLDGAKVCFVYNSSAQKVYLTNTSGVNIASWDMSGNMKISGTLTQSTTP